MDGWLGVTAKTSGGGAAELPVGVAAGAAEFGMRAGQRKADFGVVKGGRQPGGGRMARSAVGAELAFMHRWFSMAGNALGGQDSESSIGMAGCAAEFGVPTGQSKACAGVVKGCP